MKQLTEQEHDLLIGDLNAAVAEVTREPRNREELCRLLDHATRGATLFVRDYLVGLDFIALETMLLEVLIVRGMRRDGGPGYEFLRRKLEAEEALRNAPASGGRQ